MGHTCAILRVAMITSVVLVQCRVIAFIMLIRYMNRFRIAFHIRIMISFRPTARSTVAILNFQKNVPFARVVTDAYHRSRLLIQNRRRTFLRIPNFVTISNHVVPLFCIVEICINVLCINLTMRLTNVRSCHAPVPLVVVCSRADVRIRVPQVIQDFNGSVSCPPSNA